jgi:hypothetical protein
VKRAAEARKRPINTAAINEKAERTEAVLRIFRRGTREDLRALLKTWGYSKEEIEAVLIEYDAALRSAIFLVAESAFCRFSGVIAAARSLMSVAKRSASSSNRSSFRRFSLATAIGFLRLAVILPPPLSLAD